MRKRILGAAVLALACVFLTAAYSYSHFLLNQLRPLVAEKLQETLQERVQLEDLAVQGWSGFSASNLIVFDQSGQPMLEAGTVKLQFSWWDLLLRRETLTKSAVHMLHQVELTNPVLHIRQKSDGSWNFNEIPRSSDPGSPQLQAQIVLHNGVVNLALPQGNWQVEELEGSLDFIHDPAIEADLKGRFTGQEVTVKGSISGTNAKAQVGLSQLNLQDVAALFPQDLLVAIQQGLLTDTELQVEKKGLNWNLSGQTEFSQIDLDVQGIPVRQAQGLIVLTSDRISFYRTQGQVAGQDLKVSGRVFWRGEQPVLDLDVATGTLDLAQIPQYLPQNLAAKWPQGLNGQARLTAHAAGSLTDWTAQGEAEWQQFELSGYKSSQGKAGFTLNPQQLAWQDLAASVAQGQVTGEGWITFADQQAYGNLQFSQIDLAQLPAAAAQELAGQASGQVALQGPLDWSGLALQGQVRVAQGQVQGLAYDQLQLSLEKTPQSLKISQARLESSAGSLEAQGEWTQGRLTGQFACVDADLLKLQSLLPAAWQAKLTGQALTGQPIKGRLTAYGRVQGTLEQPQITADLSAQQGEVRGLPFDWVVAKIEANREGLKLIQADWFQENRTIQQGNWLQSPSVTHHQASGSVHWAGDQQIAILGQTRQARGEVLSQALAKPVYVTGNIDADWVVSGTLENPAVKLQLGLNRGSLQGFLVSAAQAWVRYDQGELVVDKVRVSSFDSDILCSGKIAPDGGLQLSVVAQNLDLRSLTSTFPYVATGRADFSGTLTGTVEDLQFDGNMASAKMTMRGLELTQLSGAVGLKGAEVSLRDLRFFVGPGSVELSGSLNLQTREVEGQASVASGPVSSLMQVAALPIPVSDGQINSEVTFDGLWDNPNISVVGNVQNLKVRDRLWDQVDVQAQWTNHVLNLEKFDGRRGNARIVAQGTAALNGPVAVSLYGANVDAGLLSDLSNSSLQLSGSSLFTVQLTGSWQNPRADISLGIDQGSLNGAQFDRLNATAVATSKAVDLQQMSLIRGPYEVDLHGQLPLSVLDASGSESMDLTLELSHSDLNLLSYILPQVRSAEGPLQGKVRLRGTLSHPVLDGEVQSSGGLLNLAGFKEPLKNLSIAIQFEDDKMKINQITAAMGRGNLAMKGEVQFGYQAGQTLPGLLDYNLDLQLERFEVKHAVFQGPIEGSLTFAPEQGQPLVRGKILLDQDTIDIPFVTEPGGSLPPIGLDITADVTKKTRFYNSLLYDFYGEGQVHVTGTAKQPRASGQYAVTHGQVSYLTTPFRIDTATAEFKEINGIIPTLNLEAKVKVQQTDVTLAVTGLATAMNLRLTSNPSMSQQEIFSLLTLGSRYLDQRTNGRGDSQFGRDQVTSIIGSGLETQLFSPVENQFRSWFGLDDFHVYKSTIQDSSSASSSGSSSSSDEKGTINRDVYNVQLSKYLTDNFMISYTMGVDHKASTWGMTYEFNKRFSTTASISNDNKIQLDVLARFPF